MTGLLSREQYILFTESLSMIQRNWTADFDVYFTIEQKSLSKANNKIQGENSIRSSLLSIRHNNYITEWPELLDSPLIFHMKIHDDVLRNVKAAIVKSLR